MEGIISYQKTFKISQTNIPADATVPGSSQNTQRMDYQAESNFDYELGKRQFMSRNSPDKDFIHEEITQIRKQLKASSNLAKEQEQDVDQDQDLSKVQLQSNLPGTPVVQKELFEKLSDEEMKSGLLKILDDLKQEDIECKENPTEEEDCILIEFWMPIDPSKGEIRLKLFLEEANISVGLDKSKDHKKMIKFTAQNIDKKFDEAIESILLYWKAEVI